MKNILLIAATVLPLVLNSCRYIGETDPFYADGHRRGTYYGVKGEIPPLIGGRRHDHVVGSTYYDSNYITRDHVLWPNRTNTGRYVAR